MAEMIGYSDVRSIRRLESGDSAGNIDKLMELSQALNISTDYLLYGKELQIKDDNKIMGLLKDKTPAEKEFAFKMLETLFAHKGLLVS